MDLTVIFGSWYPFAGVFGYLPVFLDSDRGFKVQLINLLFSLGNIGLHSAIWWIIPMKSNTFTTPIGSRVEITFNVVDSAVPVITICLNFLLLGHVKQIFKALHEADALLKDINIHLADDYQRKYSRIVMAVVLVMQALPPALIPILLSHSEFFMELLPLTIYMGYRQLSNLSFLGSIFLILVAVFIRFKSINVCLMEQHFNHTSSSRRQPRTPQQQPSHCEDSPTALEIIAVLSRLHQILCEIVEQINLAFSFQVGHNISGLILCHCVLLLCHSHILRAFTSR